MKKTIKKYRDCPSINDITVLMENMVTLHLPLILLGIRKELKEVDNLKSRKVYEKTDIPLKTVKKNIDIISSFLYHDSNNLLLCSNFSFGIKYVEVTPIHKNDDKTSKEYYFPISILYNLIKVCERLFHNETFSSNIFQILMWVLERF